MKNYVIVIYTLFIFWIMFMNGKMIALDPTLDGWIRNGMGLVLLIPLFQNFSEFIKGKHKAVNLSILAFAIISCVSAYVNYDNVNSLNVQGWNNGVVVDLKAQQAKGVVFPMISLVATVFLIEKLSEIGKLKIMVKTLFFSLLILTLFADIDALSMTDTTELAGGNSYWIGNKFAVCYTNIYTCILYYFLHPDLKRKSKCILIGLLVVTVIVCFHTQCSTALMGIFIVAFFTFFLSRRYRAKLYSVKTMFMTLFVCDMLFFFFTTWFLQFSLVQDFIVNVLHEDLTLTGRLAIYENIQTAFIENPWLGFGSGNSSTISVLYTGAYDAQNGLVDMFIQVGLLGCISFLLFLYYIFPKNRQYAVNIYPIVIFVYMMFAISMVEIPFNNKFIFFTMFILGTSTNNKKILQWKK